MLLLTFYYERRENLYIVDLEPTQQVEAIKTITNGEGTRVPADAVGHFNSYDVNVYPVDFVDCDDTPINSQNIAHHTATTTPANPSCTCIHLSVGIKTTAQLQNL